MYNFSSENCGGETGIRTLGGLAPTTVFETAPFDHSGTSPRIGLSPVGGGIAASVPPRKSHLGENRFDLVVFSVRIAKTQRQRLTDIAVTPVNCTGESMIRATCLALSLLVPAFGADAQIQPASSVPGSIFAVEEPELFAMFEAMGMYEMLPIMAEEHVMGAEAMQAGLFPGRGGEAWQQRIASIHSPERLVTLFEANFPSSDVSAETIRAVTDFMQSDAGQRLIQGEIAARRAFLEEDAIANGNAALLLAMETGDARLESLRAFNEVNDLINRNVSGALNARFSLFRGLADGGAFEDDMGEDLMIDDVLAHEPQIREATVEWLFSFQATAYADVENSDLEAYVAHSESEAGQEIIAALFIAFDNLLGTLNYDVGYAAAPYIGGEDL